MENNLKDSQLKIVITKNLESKIRSLCNRFRDKEYSGTLFYKTEGSMKDNNLTVIADDFYLQDIGSGAFTSFSNDTSLAAYIVSNDLVGYYQGLMHSHNQMQAFFSGTDMETLRKEGADTNHFVSLVVNNAGDYCAAITQKMHHKLNITDNIICRTFNNEEYDSGVTTIKEEKDEIQIFKLNIIKESVEESDLELRINELLDKKKESVNNYPWYNRQYDYTNPVYNKIPDYTNTNANQLKLPFGEFSEADDKKYKPTNTDILKSIKQLITLDLFAGYKSSIDIDKWISNMENLYSKRFKDINDFEYAVDITVDLLADEIPDYEVSNWAFEMEKELNSRFRKENKYTEVILNSISRYE